MLCVDAISYNLSSMTELSVQCEQLHKSFGSLPVVNGVSFALQSGEILALLGPSGCGKTTLLRLLAGFERLDLGRITIADTLVADGQFHLPTEKRRTGMVFQDYAIFPHLTVADNIAFGLKQRRQQRPRVAEMLDLVGLDGQGDKMPHELSGGQQQRVALARALAPEPVILLLDEPFSNLDANLRVQVRREIRDLLRKAGTTAIFVTHDQEEALFIGDRVALMRAGQLEQIGRPETLFHAPRTEFVAHFMGQSDFVPGIVAADGIITAAGILRQPTGHVNAGTVRIGVRADDFRFDWSAAPNAVIVARDFAGMDNLYTVRLRDDTLVRVRQPHTEQLEPGAGVHIAFADDHPLPVFQHGINIA